jgi:hypothetical protein
MISDDHIVSMEIMRALHSLELFSPCISYANTLRILSYIQLKSKLERTLSLYYAVLISLTIYLNRGELQKVSIGANIAVSSFFSTSASSVLAGGLAGPNRSS